MKKRGSRYLRYALYNATKYVCHWDESFRAYLQKKRSEGKHYNIALSHATKKLVRLILAMERAGEAYCQQFNFFCKYLLFSIPVKMLLLSCSFQSSNVSEMHFCNSFKKLSF